MSEFQIYINELVNNRNLPQHISARAMQIMALGGATPAQISCFFTALKMKKETQEEMAGFIEFLEVYHKKIKYDQEVLLIYANTLVDELLFVALVLSCFNTPVLMKIPRSEKSNLITNLGINADIDAQKVVTMLTNLNISILFPIKDRSLRDLMDVMSELGISTALDILHVVTSPINSHMKIIEMSNEYIDMVESIFEATEVKYAFIENKINHFNIHNIDKNYDVIGKDKSLNASRFRESLEDGDLEYFAAAIDFCSDLVVKLKLENTKKQATDVIKGLLSSGQVLRHFEMVVSASNFML